MVQCGMCGFEVPEGPAGTCFIGHRLAGAPPVASEPAGPRRGRKKVKQAKQAEQAEPAEQQVKHEEVTPEPVAPPAPRDDLVAALEDAGVRPTQPVDHPPLPAEGNLHEDQVVEIDEDLASWNELDALVAVLGDASAPAAETGAPAVEPPAAHDPAEPSAEQVPPAVADVPPAPADPFAPPETSGLPRLGLRMPPAETPDPDSESLQSLAQAAASYDDASRAPEETAEEDFAANVNAASAAADAPATPPSFEPAPWDDAHTAEPYRELEPSRPPAPEPQPVAETEPDAEPQPDRAPEPAYASAVSGPLVDGVHALQPAEEPAPVNAEPEPVFAHPDLVVAPEPASSRRLPRRAVAGAIALLLALTAAGAYMVLGPGSSAAEAAFYKRVFVPDETHRYTMSMTMRGTAEAAGETETIDLAMRMTMSETTDSVGADGSASITYGIEDLAMTMNGQSAPVPFDNLSVTARVAPDGKVLELEGTSGLAFGGLGPAGDMFGPDSFQPMLPDEAVAPGDSWTVVHDEPNPLGGDPIRVTAKNTLVETGMQDGVEVAQIRSEVSMPMKMTVSLRDLMEAAGGGDLPEAASGGSFSYDGTLSMQLYQTIVRETGRAIAVTGDGAMDLTMSVSGVPGVPGGMRMSVDFTMDVAEAGAGAASFGGGIVPRTKSA